MGVERWPSLALEEWRDTYATLHMWTQIVGKVRLAKTPLVNHWWNVAFGVTSRGLTTGPMLDRGRPFSIDFDFVDHRLLLTCNGGPARTMALAPMPVAAFHREVMGMLAALDIEVRIWPVPVEVPDPIPFERDFRHASYDGEYANRWWRILLQVELTLSRFRAAFVGKCSPVHFFWGSFDLAVTRFSGRRAPQREDRMMREAYSHEVISHGFWPGSGPVQMPAFYAYAAPEPNGLKTAAIRPPGGHYNTQMSEFVLPYDEVRRSADPEATLLEFLQSTYDAAADLAHWDRRELERSAGP
jgi:hypothetical protein